LIETPLQMENAVTRGALRKATWRLIPLIAIGYAIAYMDRVNISFAALQMNADLHFSNRVYGFGAGFFFLSYAVCEIPSNLLLYRFGARRWLARIMVTWGAIALGMMFVRTPVQFYVVRFLLGMAEAGFFPGAIFYLTQWFPPEMRARTVTRFYVSSPIVSVFMGVVAGALLNLRGKWSLAGWQWLFMVEALPAIAMGVVFYFCLPDGPADADWLTEGERIAIVDGLGHPADLRQKSKGEAVGTALRDGRVWLLGTFMLCMLTSVYAFVFSLPAIIKDVTGMSDTHVGFAIAAMYVLGSAAMVGNGILSDRAGERFWHTIAGCGLMVAGFAACGVSRAALVTIPALALIVMAYNSMQGPLFALATSFLRGRAAAAGIATMNMIAIVGGFIGPYWMGFARDWTGNYQRGLLTCAVPMTIAAGIMLHLRRMARMEDQGSLG
jgi:ACS family tartrate transporter-like MFS transporter